MGMFIHGQDLLLRVSCVEIVAKEERPPIQSNIGGSVGVQGTLMTLGEALCCYD